LAKVNNFSRAHSGDSLRLKEPVTTKETISFRRVDQIGRRITKQEYKKGKKKMVSLGKKIVSVSTAVALLFVTSGWAQPQAAPQGVPQNVSAIPRITSLSIVDGRLMASGNTTAVIGGRTYSTPFCSVPIDISLAPNQPQGGKVCPVLDLRIGVVNVNLLGLVVQTSSICLLITATEGGGVLGDIFCQIANALAKEGTTQAQALAATSDQSAMLEGITTVLNAALAQTANATVSTIEPLATHNTCAVVHAVLGPVFLNLLGLNVYLDNCANGPITVDISGVTGPGNLLGNLLCQLIGGGVRRGTTVQSITSQLAR